jgi:antitoxin component of MazEF toxin-antitoxin module
MAQRKLVEKNIRKLTRMGREGKSLGLTLPIEIVGKLGWKERQKVVVRQSGKKIIIEDWKE